MDGSSFPHLQADEVKVSLTAVLLRQSPPVAHYLLTEPKIDVQEHLDLMSTSHNYLLPPRSLADAIALAVVQWANDDKPLWNASPFPLLPEKSSQVEVVSRLQESIARLKAALDKAEDAADRIHVFDFFFESLSIRDFLTLLGQRNTEGSIDCFPLTLDMIVGSFNKRHKSGGDSSGEVKRKIELTVGARAFSKHAHRDQTQSWWGVCTGSEARKNQLAEAALWRILGDLAWVNVHQLPHQLASFELRNSLGYGLRWTLTQDKEPIPSSVEFRGFLEPPMEGGHELGWRH